MWSEKLSVCKKQIIIKGIVHPKMKICPIFIHPQGILGMSDISLSDEHIQSYIPHCPVQYRRSLYAECTVCVGHQLPGGHHPSCSKKKKTCCAIPASAPATARTSCLRLNANYHNWWTTMLVKRHQQSTAKKTAVKIVCGLIFRFILAIRSVLS